MYLIYSIFCTIVILAGITLIICALVWAVEELANENSPPSASCPHRIGETVGERLTQVVTTAPVVLNTDPVLTTLESTRQIVEERADVATLEVLHNVDEIFRRKNDDN